MQRRETRALPAPPTNAWTGPHPSQNMKVMQAGYRVTTHPHPAKGMILRSQR
jgi:hypothetical protein